MTEKIRARVILADDHPGVVEDLRAVLEPEFEVVATVGDGNALVAAAETLAPDVIVTDIAMPNFNGIAAAARSLAGPGFAESALVEPGLSGS